MQTAEIIPFDFEGFNVRTSLDECGVVWFVAKDVCACLGITKHRDAVTRLEDDERGSVLVDTLGGEQNLLAINQSGVLALTLTSRKPSAKRIRKWVTSEVLPALMKHGFYAMPGANDDVVDLADMDANGRAFKLRDHRRVMEDITRLVGIAEKTPPRMLDVVNKVAAKITGIDTVEMLQASGWEPPAAAPVPPNPRQLFMDSVAAWLDAPEQQAQTEFHGREICANVLGIKPAQVNRADLVDLGYVMRDLGWGKRRREVAGYGKGYCYLRP